MRRAQRLLAIGLLWALISPGIGATGPATSKVLAAQGDGALEAGWTLHLPFVGQAAPLRGAPVAVLGGALETVATDGRYVYAGVGHRIVVYDAIDPAAPRIVGQTAPFYAPARDLVVEDGLLYATHASVGASWYIPRDPEAGLSIYDVRDPAHPRRLGELATAGIAGRILLRQPLAFVLQEGTEVAILDVSEPRQIRLLAAVSAGADSDLALTGDLLWLYARADCSDRVCSQSRPRLMGFDVSDPAQPVLIKRIDEVGFPPGRLLGLGAVLHLGIGRVDTRGPVEGWRLEPPGESELLEVFEAAGRRWAIHRLPSGRPGLAEIVGGDDAAPEWIDRLELPEGLESGRAGGAGFVGRVEGGWHGLDLRDAGAPGLSARQPVEALRIAGDPGWRNFVALDGETGFASDQVIDLTEPASPRLERQIGRLAGETGRWGDLAKGPGAVVYLGSSRYEPGTGERDDRLTVIDAGEPAQPRVAAELSLTGPAEHLLVAGKRLYVAEWRGDRDGLGAKDGRLSVWDLSEPLAPREIGAIDGLVVAGMVAQGMELVVDARGEQRRLIRSFDLSDPARPRELGGQEMPIKAGDGMRVSGDSLLVIGPGRLLRSYELIAGQAPSLVSETAISAWPETLMAGPHLALHGDRLLVGGSSAAWAGRAGVLSISLADPMDPRVIDVWETPSVLGLDCVRARCFVATEQGIWVFDLPGLSEGGARIE